MEPDMSDVPVECLARDSRRDRRMRHDHDCVDLLGDSGEGRIARLSVNFSGAWIDREHIVPGLRKAAKDRVRGSVARP